ncbi:6-hydroxymethylpterin diphosphokinase MptE-like protein [Leptospira ilyithenensis]|uniref:6-hydroxymethylpterin diphosphokinase MptE-like protein n=1 Tax=Leptospira ilyithenensis TaxID=2484901 RepID=UPI00143826E1|nr:6-hydroxymethylpterin diphosphokinase MptE-like protein [Leptospira ilyithenensis]
MRFVQSLSPNENSLACLIGLGALHHIESLLESKIHFPFLLFWEPFPEIHSDPAFQTLWNQIAEKLTEQNIKFRLLPPDLVTEEAKEILESFQIEIGRPQIRYEIHPFPYYARHAEDEIARFKSFLLQKSESGSSVNRSTKSHFQKLWTGNYLKNLKLSSETNISKREWIQGLNLKDKDVFFLGASPSLESEWENLPQERSRCVLIAADTNIQFLLAKKIIPDAILSLDPGRGTLFHFLPSIPNTIPILTWLGANSYLFSLTNPVYLINTNHPFDQLIQFMWEKKKDPKSEKSDWPYLKNPSLNLAGMALSFAKEGGADKLILVGVGFKEEQGKSHCRGTGYESYRLPMVTRRNPLEKLQTGIYGKERKGKNKIAWESIWKKDNDLKVISMEEYKSVTKKEPTVVHTSSEHKEWWIRSFRGIPAIDSWLWEKAFQEFPDSISISTLKRWKLI